MTINNCALFTNILDFAGCSSPRLTLTLSDTCISGIPVSSSSTDDLFILAHNDTICTRHRYIFAVYLTITYREHKVRPFLVTHFGFEISDFC